MSVDQDSIEIKGQQVRLKVNGLDSKELPVTSLVRSVQASSDLELFPGILPAGLKYFVRRGSYTLAVIEQAATPRSVFVPSESSRISSPADLKTVRRWLSFPYVYLFVLFQGPALANYQQLFYRTNPLTSLDDELFLCNLPNVSAPGSRTRLPCELCISNIRNVTTAPWPDKIASIVTHVWQSGWNWDFERSNMESMFGYYRKARFDRRVCTFSAWEKETKQDPYFALKVKWKPANLTVRKAIDQLLGYITHRTQIASCRDLVNLLVSGRQYEFFDLT